MVWSGCTFPPDASSSQPMDRLVNMADEDSNRVKAYAKLEFPQHDFFIRKLSIIIGRRPPQQQQQPPPPSSSSSSTDSSRRRNTTKDQIDVDLGPIRAVSRKHAALFYDWNSGRWSIQVLGRNGCVVDGRWKAKSEIVPLRSRTKIQIAERIFHFMLPSSAEDLSSPSLVSSVNPQPASAIQSPIDRDLTHSTCSSNQPKTTDPSNEPLIISTEHDGWAGCESDCEASPSPPRSPSKPPGPLQPEQSQSESEESEDEEDPVDTFNDDDDHLAKSDDEPRPPSPPRHKAFNYGQTDLVDFNLMRSSDSDSDFVDDDDDQISSELLSYPFLPGKAPASKAPKKTVATKAPSGGRGKSAGKRPKTHTLVPEPTRPVVNGSPKKASGGKSTKQASSTKSDAVVQVKDRPKVQCITPPGAEIGTVTQKPPYTYASLITQALASQADHDGKMLVSEMCEWMAGVYPFYGAKEKDWQSAVRHNLNADKRFKRIERTPTDGGKGNFWTLKEEEWVHFDGLELRRPKEVKHTISVSGKTDNKPLCPTKDAQQIVSRSIGNVARMDLAAHHRVIVPPKSPVRPPSPSPIFNGLPVFSHVVHSQSHHDNHPFNFPCSEERQPLPPATITPELPTTAIDPNLLACSSTNLLPLPPTPPVLTPQPPPPLPPLPPPLPPPTPTTTTSTTTSPTTTRTETTKTTATTMTNKGKENKKFEIIIQEPTNTQFKKKPKTAEELKKMIEIERPMYTKGSHQLILNKFIFHHLKPNQIASLESLGPTNAIKILQKFILVYFKDKLSSSSPSPPSTVGAGTGQGMTNQVSKKSESPSLDNLSLPLPLTATTPNQSLVPSSSSLVHNNHNNNNVDKDIGVGVAVVVDNVVTSHNHTNHIPHLKRKIDLLDS